MGIFTRTTTTTRTTITITTTTTTMSTTTMATITITMTTGITITTTLRIQRRLGPIRTTRGLWSRATPTAVGHMTTCSRHRAPSFAAANW